MQPAIKTRKQRTLPKSLVNGHLIYHTKPVWADMGLFTKEFENHNGDNVPNWLLKEKYGWCKSKITRLAKRCAEVGWTKLDYKITPHYANPEDRYTGKKPSYYSTTRYVLPVFFLSKMAMKRQKAITEKAKNVVYLGPFGDPQKAIDLHYELRPFQQSGKIKELECGMATFSNEWDHPKVARLKLAQIRKDILERFG